MPDMVVMAMEATAEKEVHREATEVMAEMVLATETEVMAGTVAKEVTVDTVEKGAPTEDMTAKMVKTADIPFTITSHCQHIPGRVRRERGSSQGFYAGNLDFSATSNSGAVT